MPNGRMAVVGSANVDLVFRAPTVPAPGQTLLGSDFTSFLGGKGANQAVAAARLGADVSFIAKVGHDTFGSDIARTLGRNGVDVTFLSAEEGVATGTAGIVVADSGENAIVVASGANWKLEPEEIERALAATHPDLVLTQFEIREESVEACSGQDRLVVNPAPARDISDAFCAHIDILTPNRSEAEQLTGLRPSNDLTCWTCANVLFDKGIKNVVITLGSEGAFFATPHNGRRLPTLSVRAIDTTGAGDAFNGALATFLLQGRDLENAVQLANAVAAISTTRRGAIPSMPTLAELKEAVGRLF
ncbi:MAG TPA: ribokinase [Fimbriimonas sp.]|nr:ribokinase [Fimbriimonas sp.]